jgi:hypothetical protein
MNRPVRTDVPLRVTSVTSITPREVETSTRRPALDASISYLAVPVPVSTTTSTLSPRTVEAYLGGPTRAFARLVPQGSAATVPGSGFGGIDMSFSSLGDVNLFAFAIIGSFHVLGILVASVIVFAWH